jgi:hypothetical protein
VTAAVRREFLRMLPPAVVAGWPPDDDTPPTLALLAALQEQWFALAADVDSILDDAFPDSAADWALPYLAGLLGLPPDAGRREIAYATALRRRKGTPSAIEDFGEVVTGWPTRVIEGWRTTLWCQQLRHPVLRTASLDLRHGEHLLIGTGLDPARRSVTPGGSYHPAAVSAEVFPWQLVTYDQVEAAPLGGGRFAIHPLGVAAPIYLAPRPLEIASDAEDERPPGQPPTPRAPRDASQLPIRANWRLIDALGDVSYGPVWTLAADHPLTASGPTGPALLEVTVDGTPLPWNKIGLTALPPVGAPTPAADQVLVDPARGVLAPGSSVTGTLRTTFYRATPGELGPAASTAEPRDDVGVVIVVDPALGTHPPGQLVVADLAGAFAAALAATTSPSEPDVPQLEIRLETSDRLAAPGPVTGTPALTRWRIVAPVGMTPVIVGDLELQLVGVTVELSGFFVSGDAVVGPAMTAVDLVGLTTDATAGKGVRVDPTAWTTNVSATRCLLGPIRADLAAYAIELHDCVVDGRGAQPMPCGGDPGGDLTRSAVAAADRFPPDLVATGVTFVGPVGAGEVWVADCLFTVDLRTTVTSTGCIRYCQLSPADDPQAHPPAYRSLTTPLPPFGDVGLDGSGYYAPLLTAPGPRPAAALLQAASDGGEIGAYHHARRGPLALRLAARLPEMSPLSLHTHLLIAEPEDST